MPHAIIQGEVHTSSRDKDSLKERLGQVDAILRESMNQDLTDQRNLLYLVLFAGMKLYRNTIQRMFYQSDNPVFQLAGEQGVAVHRMDTSVATWNDRISIGKKSFLLGISGLVTYSTVAGIDTAWVRPIAGIILFIMLYFLYTALLTISERDDLMAETINQISEEHGYENVLVSVGDAHVRGLADRLEAEGWTVDAHGSSTLFSRIIRPVMNVLNRL